ncbi:hypothetical protein G6F65_019318 [Rhizopus arrhizus]|nr:hypothetical protein G6F65_019318 [Rhizopus arrhizus]
MVAVRGTGRRIDERLHLRIAGGDQHVQEAAYVHLVGGDRIFQRTRHGAQRGLMQHEVHAVNGAAASIQVADIAFHEGKARPLLGRNRSAHFIQVALVTGCVVVQAGDGVILLQEGFLQVRPDEAGAAGHQPLARRGGQFLLDGLKACCHG